MKTQLKFTIAVILIFYIIGSGINASFNLSDWPKDVRQLTGGSLLSIIVIGWAVISFEQIDIKGKR